MHRGQLGPKMVTNSSGEQVPDGVEWDISFEDAFGNWARPTAADGSIAGQAVWGAPDPETIESTPRLMSVGDGDPHVFACVGDRMEDDSDWSTWLIESISPTRLIKRGPMARLKHFRGSKTYPAGVTSSKFLALTLATSLASPLRAKETI